jgi:hypothetical protein
MLTVQQREKLQVSFQEGSLKIASVSPSGNVEWRQIQKVHRNEVPWETILDISTRVGLIKVTAGHRVYTRVGEATEAQYLKVGDPVLILAGGILTLAPIESVKAADSRRFMYDLTIEGNHNLILHETGLVVHNCPDKFYHFRPPEFEGDIGQYNRIFGQIWEDAELLEYLERALDWFNMLPPNTGGAVPTLDSLVASKPQWRTAIIWGAIVHACFALSLNWVADEFSLKGDQEVTVFLSDGTKVDIPIKELYEVCKGVD